MLGKLKKKINDINLGHNAKVVTAVTSATIFSLFMTSCEQVSSNQEKTNDIHEVNIPVIKYDDLDSVAKAQVDSYKKPGQYGKSREYNDIDADDVKLITE